MVVLLRRALREGFAHWGDRKFFFPLHDTTFRIDFLLENQLRLVFGQLQTLDNIHFPASMNHQSMGNVCDALEPGIAIPSLVSQTWSAAEAASSVEPAYRLRFTSSLQTAGGVPKVPFGTLPTAELSVRSVGQAQEDAGCFRDLCKPGRASRAASGQ
jgi:hypothetical protein